MTKNAVAPPAPAASAPAAAPDALEAGVTVDPLGVEVGYALVSLVDESQGGTLLARIRSVRRQIATETGVVVPAVHVADNLQLGPRQYTILVKGVEVARGELYADRLLAINPGTAGGGLEGVQTREPAFCRLS
jgi:flagellar biosynthesis protein FlhA